MLQAARGGNGSKRLRIDGATVIIETSTRLHGLVLIARGIPALCNKAHFRDGSAGHEMGHGALISSNGEVGAEVATAARAGTTGRKHFDDEGR